MLSKLIYRLTGYQRKHIFAGPHYFTIWVRCSALMLALTALPAMGGTGADSKSDFSGLLGGFLILLVVLIFSWWANRNTVTDSYLTNDETFMDRKRESHRQMRTVFLVILCLASLVIGLSYHLLTR